MCNSLVMQTQCSRCVRSLGYLRVLIYSHNLQEDKKSISTGSTSLVYKRDVWEISFDHETRILTKIIKLQDTDLVCLFVSLTSLGWIKSETNKQGQ